MTNQNWLDSLLDNIRNISIITGFDQHWYPMRMVSPHNHTCYQMDYFYGGHGTIVINKADYAVKRGDLFICNPGDIHKYQAAREKPMENISLKFEIKSTAPAIVFPNYIGNLGLLSRDHLRDLENHLARACVEANKQGSESLILASAFAEVFFALLVGYLRELKSIASSETNSYCDLVMDYIKRHYDHQITLNDLAKIAGIHPKYLCHKFSSEMGMPPMQAISQVRMEAAKKLLINTTLPVSEVAFRVGYMDIAHFSKRFKELFGISPKDFRKTESSAFHEYEAVVEEAKRNYDS